MRFLLIIAMGLLGGCHTPDFEISRARAAYPYDLHTTDTTPIEVFRDGTELTVVNSTANHWPACVMWINQRFSAPMPAMRAGQMVTLSLDNFYDDLGVVFPSGGLFAIRRPMPVRLVELQLNEEVPMIGLVAIRKSESQ
ncbi:MAG: hypothetical protein MK077_00605 [Phycisphaerales bacterium]|nr:hypothetical protein [Phycisphaerales bacterium]